MIEADVTANKNNRKLKDDSAFLLNDVEITFYDKTIKNIEKQKYEQAFSECKKRRSLIKTVVEGEITVLSKKITRSYPI